MKTEFIQFIDPEPLEEEPEFLKYLSTPPKMDTVNLSPSLPQKDLWPFIRFTVHWGKIINQIF